MATDPARMPNSNRCASVVVKAHVRLSHCRIESPGASE